MKVGVLGTGHVGLVTCATLAHLGHDVVGVDEDQAKIASLRAGKAPFFEPRLDDLLAASDRLAFGETAADAVAGADVVFVCVGTPPEADGEANLAAVERAAVQIAESATGPLVVVEKSTVPAGTWERVAATLRKRRPEVSFEIVSNPEFLREGTAVQDSLGPDRILVGAESEEGFATMRELFHPLLERGVPLIETDVTTAELAKHACNAFLAMKISYMNALARICEPLGADLGAVVDVMGSDPRIGAAFLSAGMGYGGYCLPKDVGAFRALARRVGYDFALLDEVARINDDAVEAVATRVKDASWNVSGKRVALLGLAFKPGTDDVRLSPSLALISRLRDLGADVVGHDPQANQQAALLIPDLVVVEDPYAAAAGADVIVIGTGWPEFADLDWERIAGVMEDRVVVDGCNILDPASVTSAGLDYHPIGRPSQPASA